MKFSEIFVGQRVFDRWFPEYGIGTVMEILEDSAKILFPKTRRLNGSIISRDSILRYSELDVGFLEKEKVRPPIPLEDIKRAVKKVIGERKGKK